MSVKKWFASPKKRNIFLGALVLICIVAFYGYLRYSEMFPSTDDAYVHANVVHVAAQVSGKIQSIDIQNNAYVHKGEKLFVIDPKPYQLDLLKAKADVLALDKTLAENKDAIASMQAVLAQDKAQLVFLKLKYERYETLNLKEMVSHEARDEAFSAYKVQEAKVNASQYNVKQSALDYAVTKAKLKGAKISVDSAKLNLSYTIIYARANGHITDFSLRPGSMVNVGDSLFVLVANKDWWVNANFKETSLARIHDGQKVKVVLDMYPDVKFTGVVESISYANGSEFSLLPPENATGNWVKVTQRFPVKIILTNIPKSFPLRMGASSTVTVDTFS
jgi:membrane fusion protein, multidrug efflux system